LCYFDFKEVISDKILSEDEAIVAHKYLKFTQRSLLFESPFRNAVWRKNRLGSIMPPYSTGYLRPFRNGIYTLKTLNKARDELSVSHPYSFTVVVELRIWGRVIEFEDGYLCEQAKITKVYVRNDATSPFSRQIANTFPDLEIRYQGRRVKPSNKGANVGV